VQSNSDLMQIVSAARTLRVLLGFRKGGQQQRRKNGNDSDHDKQFDESERGLVSYGSAKAPGREALQLDHRCHKVLRPM
jgi:hypothetical protein